MDIQSIILNLTTSVLFAILGFFIGKIRNSQKQFESLKHGLQALLRDRMITLYNEAKKTGHVSLEDKSNFDNLYNNYHALGLNGVMDQIHEEYINMEDKNNAV